MEEENHNEIYWVDETWKDEYNSLMQTIRYLFNDPIDKKAARELLNPNLTILWNKVYRNIKRRNYSIK